MYVFYIHTMEGGIFIRTYIYKYIYVYIYVYVHIYSIMCPLSAHDRLDFATRMHLHGTRDEHNRLILGHLRKHLIARVGLVDGTSSAVHESCYTY